MPRAVQNFTAYFGFGANVLGDWFEKYDGAPFGRGPWSAPRTIARSKMRVSEEHSASSASRSWQSCTSVCSWYASFQNSPVGNAVGSFAAFRMALALATTRPGSADASFACARAAATGLLSTPTEGISTQARGEVRGAATAEGIDHPVAFACRAPSARAAGSRAGTSCSTGRPRSGRRCCVGYGEVIPTGRIFGHVEIRAPPPRPTLKTGNAPFCAIV
jgi:hypothetical protein